ncbi:MAG: hypothetical protein ACLT98_09795 [Eggerthellaceae bacterium]
MELVPIGDIYDDLGWCQSSAAASISMRCRMCRRVRKLWGV